VGTRRVLALRCRVAIVNVKSAFVDVRADVLSVAFKSFQTFAFGFVRFPAGNNLAFRVFVAFLVAANVIRANVICVLFVSISADTFIASRSIAADSFWHVGAEKRVLEALVHVLAFFEAVALESGFTRALNGSLVFRHAISVFNARAVS